MTKTNCKNCQKNFIYRGINVVYCSSKCYKDFYKVKERKKRKNNIWLVYWKYKIPQMLRYRIINPVSEEHTDIFKVCDYKFNNDTFINKKQKTIWLK